MIVTNSLSGGGAERSMNLLCNILSSRGWTVSLIPINSSLADLVKPNCEIIPINRRWKGGVIDLLKAIWTFNKIVHAWKPQLVILNCDLPELFGALLWHRKQLIAVEHINHPWKGRRILGRFVRKILGIKKTKWVAVSNHFLIWPGNKLPDRILKNSISQDFNKVLPNFSTGEKTRLKRLIFVGRLTAQKRPDWAVDVAAACKIKLEIFGTGEQENHLRQLSETLGASVHFNSYRNDLWELIETGDLLLVPSEYEGDGLVVVEALAAGMPLLISDIFDFRRFGFPKDNYCGSRAEFVERINSNRENLNYLLVPTVTSNLILQERSRISVGDSWEEFLRGSCKVYL
jgi:glycosyltransferase involved in cell wall biosynthesis